MHIDLFTETEAFSSKRSLKYLILISAYAPYGLLLSSLLWIQSEKKPAHIARNLYAEYRKLLQPRRKFTRHRSNNHFSKNVAAVHLRSLSWAMSMHWPLRPMDLTCTECGTIIILSSFTMQENNKLSADLKAKARIRITQDTKVL